MEISSNSDLLKYVTPDGSMDPTEDSFLEDFEVIREGDGDDHSKYPIRNCRTPPTTETIMPSTSASVPSMNNSTEGGVTTVSSSGSSTTSYDDGGSQLTSIDVKHYMEENLKLKDRLKELKETLNITKSQMSQIVEGYTKACEEDKQKYKNCQELAREAVEENTNLKQQITTLKQQIESLEAEMKEMKNVPNEADFVNLESLETQMKAKDEQIILQQKKVEDLATHLEHEKAQNTELKNFIRTFESSQCQAEQIEKLKGDVTAHQMKITQMNGELIERDEMIEVLRAQYESSQTSMSSHDQALAAKDADNAALKNILSEKNVQIKELQEALIEKNQCFSHVNEALNERNKEYNSLYQLFLAKNAQVEELNNTIGNAEDLRQMYQEKIFQLEEESRNSKKVIDDLDGEIRLLKTSVAALSTENESISHWKAQCDAFQADYLNMVSQRDLLDIQVFELNKELTELREKSQKQQDELDTLHNTHIRFAQEHINREPPNEAASVNSGNQVTQSGDLLSHVINNFKRGVSLLWDGDNAGAESEEATGHGTEAASASAPPESIQNQSIAVGTSELPPCPVCGKIFYSYGNLQEHSWNCGKSNISDPSLCSHLDPFVFVPQQ